MDAQRVEADKVPLELRADAGAQENAIVLEQDLAKSFDPASKNEPKHQVQASETSELAALWLTGCSGRVV